MKEWTEVIEGKEVKVVNSQWYDVEAKTLYSKVDKAYEGAIEVHDLFAHSRLFHENKAVKMGVNWAGLGNVSTDRAMKFAQNLMEAAKLADEFKYNGYFVRYFSLEDLDEDEKNEIRDIEYENYLREEGK